LQPEHPVDFGKEAADGGRSLQTVSAPTGRNSDRAPRMARVEPAILRLIVPLGIFVLIATIVCSVLAFVLARQADDYLEAEHRQALRGAIEALQAVSPDLSQMEPKLILILERASGLKGLRFEYDPPHGEHEVQALIDAKGRIVGWFSWEAERPATKMITRLLPFAVLVGLGLFGFASLAMWQLSRLDFLLAKSEQHVRRLEHEDLTTGLPNRNGLLESLGRSLASRKGDEPLSIAVLDLDGFSEVKDAVGSESGIEEIVLEVANRLRASLPPNVTLGRLRRERFAWIIPAGDPDLAFATAEAARGAVSRAVWVNEAVQISASIGLAVAPHDGTGRDDLLRHAKLALRAVHRRGHGLVMRFTPDMEADFEERRFIRRELSRALAARAFELYYQPIVKADGGSIVGVEALLRWNHASRGFIPPAVFVRVAEEAGMMDQLGEFVLRRALADAARWPGLFVAVNLSPVQVRDRKFVDLVAAVLKESRIAPSRVVLEITEGVLIDDPETAKARLEDLRALGVRLALDDFGSGYSSLTYLQRLPFDKLKIDRGFVAALDRSANTGVIIQAIVALGRALGMSVLIEGVETEEQRVLLRLAGCHEMQGFLFARPTPREEIDRLLNLVASGSPGLPLRAEVNSAIG
jgi:diguanylate cyclase (GGDEF)-like protein